MENIKPMTMVEVLNAALKVGFVAFTYKKVDGTIRHAVGTKNIDRIMDISSNGIPQSKNDKNPNLVPYFDLTKMAWRCFKKGNLKSIDFENPSFEEAIEVALTIQVDYGYKDAFVDLMNHIRAINIDVHLDNNNNFRVIPKSSIPVFIETLYESKHNDVIYDARYDTGYDKKLSKIESERKSTMTIHVNENNSCIPSSSNKDALKTELIKSVNALNEAIDKLIQQQNKIIQELTKLI